MVSIYGYKHRNGVLCFLSDGVGEHQQSGMCRQEVLQHVRVWEHLEGGDAAGLQLLYKVRRS